MSDNWLESFKQALANGDHDGRLDEITQVVAKRTKEMSVWPAIKELSYLREHFEQAVGQRSAQSRASAGSEINARLHRVYEHTNPMVRTLCDSLRRDLLIHLLDVPPDRANAMAASTATALISSGLPTSVRVLTDPMDGKPADQPDQPAEAGNLSAASPASTADGGFLPGADVKFQDEIDRESSS